MKEFLKVWIANRNFPYLIYLNDFDIEVKEGVRVLVPLVNQQVIGYVVGKEEEENIKLQHIRKVIEIIDNEPLLPQNLLKLTKWAANYYLRPWGEFIHIALPSALHLNPKMKITITRKGRLKVLSPIKLPKQQHQMLEYINQRGTVSINVLRKEFKNISLYKELAELEKDNFIKIKRELQENIGKSRYKLAVELIQDSINEEGLTKRQKEILNYLSEKRRNTLVEEIIRDLKVSTSIIKRLQEKGYIRIYQEIIKKELLLPDILISQEVIKLNDDQLRAFNTLMDLINKNEFAVSLLHGVTASGKTELYTRLMKEVLQRGESALMLVPEISLVPALMNRFKNIFGEGIGILHSGLSPLERAEQWKRIRSGEVKVVLGVRSSIYAPLENIGLIVVDEEHDDSFKQTDNPRYNARDLAIIRAKIENCLVILGSATPSLESYHWAKKGRYVYINLPKRVQEIPMPEIKIINMREEYKKFGDPYFSSELIEELNNCLQHQHQAIILMNRRGYANYLLCRECGETIQCPRCSISLHYHKQYQSLLCHYCGLQQKIADKCSNCGSDFISYIGIGTEKIEALLKEKFPTANIARLDSDVASNQKKLIQLLSDFSYHKIDFLVGTSIIGKGHHFPNVTIVGIISADSSLGLADFRMAEKTFQLITQVAGRAGRGEIPGKVIVQSYFPSHYAVESSKHQNYDAFYEKEIKFRANLQYPPFLSLANIVISSGNRNKASEAIKDLASYLRKIQQDYLKILGPSPCPIYKKANKFRFHLIIKLLRRETGKEIIKKGLEYFQRKYSNLQIYCDIDPISLL